MILQSLAKLYDALYQKGEAPREGFMLVKCTTALWLDESGRLLSVIPLKQTAGEGKKAREVPLLLRLPEAVVKTVGIVSNFLYDTCMYVLGMAQKGDQKRADEAACAFRALHHRLLDGVDSVPCKALLAFIDHVPSFEEQLLIDDAREALLEGGNIVFKVGDRYIHDDPLAQAAWLKEYSARTEENRIMPCLITGESLPVADGHGKIKGVRNASTMGASIVAFNHYTAATSFGLDEYENSPISIRASFAFTTALNLLLADQKHQTYLGDATVIYWSEDADTAAQDFFDALFEPPGTKEADQELHKTFESLSEGRFVGDFRLDQPFFVLGLSPNAGRISIRLFLRDTLGDMALHLQRHYEQLRLVHGPADADYPSPWWLLKELANPNSRDKQVPPPLAGLFLRAILSGGRYPESLLGTVIMRIRAERSINYCKAALIKAFLMRNVDQYKEVPTVALNKETDCKPYVLGRLFSVLEQIQQSANPGINATIKDRYLASASATPGVVFPQLLRLQSAHMAKLSDAPAVYYGKMLGEVMGKLDPACAPFPAQLSLEDQGMFFLGYYHQDQARYEKKEDKGNV